MNTITLSTLKYQLILTPLTLFFWHSYSDPIANYMIADYLMECNNVWNLTHTTTQQIQNVLNTPQTWIETYKTTVFPLHEYYAHCKNATMMHFNDCKLLIDLGSNRIQSQNIINYNLSQVEMSMQKINELFKLIHHYSLTPTMYSLSQMVYHQRKLYKQLKFVLDRYSKVEKQLQFVELTKDTIKKN